MNLYEEQNIRKECLRLYTILYEEVYYEDDSAIPPEEIEDIDPIELIHHITDSVKDLISLKRTMKTLSDYSTLSGDRSYQEQLQALEGEVRNHIKLELQMKVYADSLQDQLDKKVSEQQIKREIMESTIRELEVKKRDLRGKIMDDSSLKFKNESDKASVLLKNTEEIKLQMRKDKTELNDRVLEIQKLKKEGVEYANLLSKSSRINNEGTALEIYKKKYLRARAECLKVQRKIHAVHSKTCRRSKSPIIRSKENEKRSVSPVLRSFLKNPYKIA